MKRTRLSLISLVAALMCTSATYRSASIADQGIPLRAVSSPSGVASAQPRLIAVENGVAMSWLEKYGRSHRLRWSRWGGRQWSRPVTIAQGDSFFVNWADFPSIRSLGEKSWAAHWLWKSAAGPYAYDVRLSVSKDDGRTWSRPLTPHRDGTTTEHGFVSLLDESPGVRAVWLDGRNFSGHGESEHAGADMTVRTAVIQMNGTMAQEQVLDGRCCECCATAAVRTSRGMLVAYRDRSADEIRDIALVRHEDGRWTKPYLLHRDGWKIAGCPVNGPAMDASGDQVVAAWFTAASETARVFAAFSKDGGGVFSKPIRIDGGNPIGRVGTTLLRDGSALVSWLETESGKTAIKVRHVTASGGLGSPKIVAISSSVRASGFPQIVRMEDDVWFAWTTPGAQPQIKLAYASLRTLVR